MFDLPYFATHPLLALIARHCAVLSEQADQLRPGSAVRKALNRRICELEQYKLPKPDARDLSQTEPIFDASGQQIGERHSLRKRFVGKRRGRPEEFRIKTRAALEERLADPRTTWRELAMKFGFKDKKELERAVRRLKSLLLREGIEFRPKRTTPAVLPSGNNCLLPENRAFELFRLPTKSFICQTRIVVNRSWARTGHNGRTR